MSQDFDAEKLIQDHGKDIGGLGEKMSKCYSSEKYEEFQMAVEKIALKTIDGDGREKIKKLAKESTKEFLDESTWRKITFWLPTAIAVAAIIVAYYK